MILSPLVAVVALSLVITSLNQQTQRMKGELIHSQLKVEELSSKNQQLLGRVEDVMAERDAMDAHVDSLRQRLTAATVDLEETHDELETLQWRLKRLSESKETLETRVVELSEQRDQQERRVVNLEQEKTELERTLTRLRERLTFLDRDYQQMALKVEELERQQQQPTPSGYGVVSVTGPVEPAVSSQPPERLLGSPPTLLVEGPGPTVELPPIIVRKDQAGTTAPVRGRLVEINEPHRFVVVDKGTTDGVRVGMRFDILRGVGTVIGQATVVRVRPQLAACDVVRTQSAEPLRVGDVAVQAE